MSENGALIVLGIPGQAIALETTIDFAGWSEIAQSTIGSDGSTQIPAPTTVDAAFFRARTR
jgi:hypothetical protein